MVRAKSTELRLLRRHGLRHTLYFLVTVHNLAQGYSKKEVADKIGVSYHTIAFHVRNIFDKLDGPNLTAAIAKAARQNII